MKKFKRRNPSSFWISPDQKRFYINQLMIQIKLLIKQEDNIHFIKWIDDRILSKITFLISGLTKNLIPLDDEILNGVWINYKITIKPFSKPVIIEGIPQEFFGLTNSGILYKIKNGKAYIIQNLFDDEQKQIINENQIIYPEKRKLNKKDYNHIISHLLIKIEDIYNSRQFKEFLNKLDYFRLKKAVEIMADIHYQWKWIAMPNKFYK